MGNKKFKCPTFLIGLQYKVFYFMFYAGYMPLLLFLPVYFKYIGLSPVYVGILAGIRPILQSIGTPFLVAMGEKFRSQRILFIISCLVMIGRVLIIFLLLRPTNQRCNVTYTNITDHTVREKSHVVEHKLSKRSVITDYWSRSRNGDRDEMQNASTYNSINNDTIRSTRAPPTKKAKSDIIVDYHLVNDNAEVYSIFIILFILGLLGDWFESTIFTLVDHSYTANRELENGQFGLTRLWGNLGWGIITPVVGVIVYYFHHLMCGETVGTFHYVFYFFIGFTSVALLVGSHLDFTSNPRDKISNEVHSALSNFQYGLFLFASSYSGFCNGFLFTFVNWFIDSLGGSALIMGVATGCKCVVDMVLFFLLQRIIDYFGHMATISIGFIGHIVVFLSFFAVKIPWLVVVVETVHALFYALMTSTCISFLIHAAPAGSSPRMQAVLQGIYWGIGTGCGAIFGGYCLNHVGFPRTFLAFTVITCIVSFIFLVVQLLVYMKDPDAMDEMLSEASSNFDGDDEESPSEGDEEYQSEKE